MAPCGGLTQLLALRMCQANHGMQMYKTTRLQIASSVSCYASRKQFCFRTSASAFRKSAVRLRGYPSAGGGESAMVAQIDPFQEGRFALVLAPHAHTTSIPTHSHYSDLFRKQFLTNFAIQGTSPGSLSLSEHRSCNCLDLEADLADWLL